MHCKFLGWYSPPLGKRKSGIDPVTKSPRVARVQWFTARVSTSESRSDNDDFEPTSADTVTDNALDTIFAIARFAKKHLRRLLMHWFPVSYQMLLTKGNFDEPPWTLIVEQRKLFQLMRQPPLDVLLKQHPSIVRRPYHWYLAKGFTKKARRSVLKHHYIFLGSRANSSFFWEILRKRLLMWQKVIRENVFAIRLSFTGELHHEGDLQLEFLENSVRLYHLSFSIAPGPLVGSSGNDVILIAHVLGVAGHFDAIRRATKNCLDIAPPYLLMAAIQGISDALGVAVIAGVKNSEQITANSADSRIANFDYDAFWLNHLGLEDKRFYLMSVPVAEKPLSLISTSHRRRTRLKRDFKKEVADTSKTAFQAFLTPQELRRPADPPAKNL